MCKLPKGACFHQQLKSTTLKSGTKWRNLSSIKCTANHIRPLLGQRDSYVEEAGEEVQMVTSRISENFVPTPKQDNSLGDLLIVL